MPRIFDNIEQSLLPPLQETIQVANCTDFCIGCFNLRDWKYLDCYIDSGLAEMAWDKGYTCYSKSDLTVLENKYKIPKNLFFSVVNSNLSLKFNTSEVFFPLHFYGEKALIQ